MYYRQGALLAQKHKQGEVIDMIAMMIYRVEYEDSQIEDYSLQELQDILVE